MKKCYNIFPRYQIPRSLFTIIIIMLKLDLKSKVISTTIERAENYFSLLLTSGRPVEMVKYRLLLHRTEYGHCYTHSIKNTAVYKISNQYFGLQLYNAERYFTDFVLSDKCPSSRTYQPQKIKIKHSPCWTCIICHVRNVWEC